MLIEHYNHNTFTLFRIFKLQTIKFDQKFFQIFLEIAQVGFEPMTNILSDKALSHCAKLLSKTPRDRSRKHL